MKSKTRININRDRKPKSTEDFFSNFENEEEKLKSDDDSQGKKDEKAIDTRHTWIVRKDQLETLKDYVHSKRLEGETDYSQKRAIEEALDLLFKSIDKIEKRNKR
jgi:hypothetical protein